MSDSYISFVIISILHAIGIFASSRHAESDTSTHPRQSRRNLHVARFGSLRRQFESFPRAAIFHSRFHGGRYLAFSLSDECRLINGVWLPRLSLVSIAASRQTRQSLRARSLWKRGRNEGFSGNPRRGLVTELAKRVFTWRRERFCARRTKRTWRGDYESNSLPFQ